MSHEKRPSSIETQRQDPELEALAERGREKQAERLRSPERSVEQDADKSKHEALEQARSVEKEAKLDRRVERPEAKADLPPNSKAARRQAFDSIMDEVRSDMPPVQRAFSKFIHAPMVEKVSDAAGKTVARPNAILAGSLTAFVTVLLVYLVARYYGYPLSGSETMLAFAGGWLVGIVFDFLRVMVTGRHN